MLTGDEKGNLLPWKEACRKLIWYPNTESSGAETPLHIAAKNGYVDIAKLIVQVYKSMLPDEPADQWLDDKAYPAKCSMVQIPWLIMNSADDVPLFVALKTHHDDFGVYLLSMDTCSNILSLEEQVCKSIHKFAMVNGCLQSAKTIFEKTVRHRAEDLLKFVSETRNADPGVLSIIKTIAKTFLENSAMLTPEMIDRLQELISTFKRNPRTNVKLELEEASRRGESWLVKLFLDGDNSMIDNSTAAWQIACEKGHISTLLSFIAHDHFIKLCERYRHNPLHHVKNLQYEQYKNLLENPVLKRLVNERDIDGATPLHLAIKSLDLGLTRALLETAGIQLDIEDHHQKTAMDLLEEPRTITNSGYFELYKDLLVNSGTTEKLKNRVGSNGFTPLHRAIEGQLTRLAEVLIETEGVDFEKQAHDGRTALDMILELCKSNLFWFKQYKKLLAKPEMLPKLKNRQGNCGSTPLHLAIKWDDLELAKSLLQIKDLSLNIKDTNDKTALDLIEESCNQPGRSWLALYKEMLSGPLMTHELKNRVDCSGDTLLYRAIKHDLRALVTVLMDANGVKFDIKDRKDETALDMIEKLCKVKSDDDFWFKQYKKLLAKPEILQKLKNRKGNNGGTTPFHLAVEWDDFELAKLLVRSKCVKFNVKGTNGKTALDLIKEQCNLDDHSSWRDLSKEVLENVNNVRELKNYVGQDGYTLLHHAIKDGDLQLVKTLLETRGIDLDIKDREKNTAVNLLEEKCEQSTIDGTSWYDLYKDLLENQEHKHVLKNRIGYDGDTPLHRAIKRKDPKLARALLETKGVQLDIEDKNKKTALDLLEERRKDLVWAEMCQEIMLDPSLKIFKFKYLQKRTSLQDMQNTLTVVAALIATITFAAGITVPGGNSGNGTANLGKYAAFLVFSIANALAMCSSMVVLFTMVGAMIWEAHPKATSLVDLCVFLLQLSLFGTIVAFMTGVYAIMAINVKWVAFVIITMCSVSFVLAFLQVSTFWPPLYKPCYWLKNDVSDLWGKVKSGNTNWKGYVCHWLTPSETESPEHSSLLLQNPKQSLVKYDCDPGANPDGVV